uniref:hypothetical protein n=1 Tax=Actinoplanes sp. CA-084688 TaxID=3239901 RepID=UPI003F491976
MGRSTNPDHQGQDPQGARPQPYVHRLDLQKGGEPATDRAALSLPQAADGLFKSGISFSSTSESKSGWAVFGLGNGEITPMSIAAISAGTSIFFIFGGCVLCFRDHPGWMFAVFLLAFLQVCLAAGLAFYESATRRTIAINEVMTTSTTVTEVVIPTSHAERDVPTETLLPPTTSLAENPTTTTQALEGGEPIQ